jgi:hypothetical protein
MKSLYCLGLLSVLLAACESIPSGNALLTEIAQPTKTFVFITTTIPTSMPEPTLVPLGEFDLEPILLMPGDLPSNYELSVFY